MTLFHEPTGTENTYMANPLQGSRLYLAVWEPTVLFTARVNQTFTTTDQIREITYDTGAGGYGDVFAGMTLKVGSAAGLSDVGVCRIRSISGTKITIGETSEIDWEDNLYLTVTDEISIWERGIRISDGNILVDGDIDYSDQHSKPDPIPVIGGPLVLWLTGVSVSYAWTTNDSYIIRGSIASYSWAKIGGVSANWSIANGSTATPTLTFTAAGQYIVGCTLTSAQGKAFTTYRYIFVFDDTNQPYTDFILSDNSGDFSAGGWNFTIQCPTSDAATIDDRAFVILFARDFYGATEISMGSHNGRENILSVGWVAGETITQDAQAGNVQFSVQGPAEWMKKITGWPQGIQFTKDTPTDWTEMQAMTTRDGVTLIIHERSTLDLICDVIMDDDGKYNAECSSPRSNLWEQLTNMTTPVNMTVPCFDQYGRLWIQPDANLMLLSARSDIPEIADIDTSIIKNPVDFEHVTIPNVSILDFSGVVVDSSGNGSPIFTYSNGRVPKHYGAPAMVDKMLLSSQKESNRLAGLKMGKENSAFPSLEFELLRNNHFFDVAPQMYANITINASENLRGVAYIGRAIPRRISRNWQDGVLKATIDFEAETFPEISTIGDPEDPTESNTPEIPTEPETPEPEPPITGTVPVQALVVLINHGVYFTFGDDVTGINSSSPVWYSLNGMMVALENFDNPGFVVDIASDWYARKVYIQTQYHVFVSAIAEGTFGAEWYLSQTSIKAALPESDPDKYSDNTGVKAIACDPYTGFFWALCGHFAGGLAWHFRAFDGEMPEIVSETTAGAIANFYLKIGEGMMCGNLAGGGGFLGVYNSDDDSETFTERATGYIGLVIQREGTKEFCIVIGGSNLPTTVIKTIDGGETLEPANVAATSSALGAAALSPDGTILISATLAPGNVPGSYLSSDYGVTWTLQSAFSATTQEALSALRGFGGGVWVGMGLTKLWVSLDDGVTWTDKTGNLNTDFGLSGTIAGTKIEPVL